MNSKGKDNVTGIEVAALFAVLVIVITLIYISATGVANLQEDRGGQRQELLVHESKLEIVT